MSSRLPSIVYHELNSLAEDSELKHIVDATIHRLNKGHITAILNSFFINTKICVNGIPYIKIKGLSNILRTGNSGAERPLIYQGMPGITSAAEIIEIKGEEHISGPTLVMLIEARMNFSRGRTKEYLQIAKSAYERIINLPEVRDLKDVFLSDIDNNRPLLKIQRISELNITACEFSGNSFTNKSEVEFSHIESVISNPSLALDINNGVIILKTIHHEITRRKLHGFSEMYEFCKEKGFSTKWAD
ncbi:hypothetical protein [Endozoicomonas sp. 4G]|uniref:hypothetical protein n=1 Tax=Endozoicomonas sp. 4G TaxID=2872754 RepID=UPI002079051F|nr:hypothetical protein [Endozoicomonas sp. 4G]